jgi:23S rRNA (cytosine1962-C5)-methyltransferase
MNVLQSVIVALAILFSHFYSTSIAFQLPTYSRRTLNGSSPEHTRLSSIQVARQDQRDRESDERISYKSKRKDITLADLRKELLKNPPALGKKSNVTPRKKRTRRRAENPQQSYVYAAQRKKNQESNQNDREDDEKSAAIKCTNRYITEARRMGLVNPASQHSNPLVDGRQPEIVGQLRVGDEKTGSGTFAFIINKPQGWSILGGSGSSGNSGLFDKPSQTSTDAFDVNKRSKSSHIKSVKTNEARRQDQILDHVAILERAEIETNVSDDQDFGNIPGVRRWSERMSPEEGEEAEIEGKDYHPSDIPGFDEEELLGLLSKEEIVEYCAEKNQNPPSIRDTTLEHFQGLSEEDLDPIVAEKVKRTKARMSEERDVATILLPHRHSVVAWLKKEKMQEGIFIRGGNFWTALAGATDVDDTGLVLLVPKENCNNIFVDCTKYIAVVGNGKCINSKPAKDLEKNVHKQAINIELVSKLKRNREGDVTTTVRVGVSENASTCSSIIGHIQTQFDDGIRGDPLGNPLDRRAPRRLIHCNLIAVSSLLVDETFQAESELPDDIAILADRLNNQKFRRGSFLGRAALQENPLTNAYREINGAADGFPGWTVDRYGDWLLVQHDDQESLGPLPSIHDGYTSGVYLLPCNQNRGAMGAKDKTRPFLLEGRPAPETVEILENGIKYQVSLDRDLSTGIFLDQRPNRAWLAQNCNSDTHVLNCFAHCGAFTVAAATAGASTVSIDLNKKWLDRIQPQLEANSVKPINRHDCIYGDCFDWLEKLARRGEKFDIVILDPPSSSVGKKKRRWSVKNEMDELVQLAAPLVKKGGLLWTVTNSASIPTLKFANQCWKGLNDAGIKTAKLDRIQPMSVDFPSIGPQPVKNLVWRIN